MRQPNSKPHRPVFSREERSQWISRLRSSGLTQAQFAHQHGLKVTTLQKWLYGRGPSLVPKRRPRTVSIGRGASHRSSRTAAIFHRKPQHAATATFREVTVPSLGSGPGYEGWAAELTWPSGVRVRLRAGAEAGWIEALLVAVDQIC
jgi:hypothetical protein